MTEYQIKIRPSNEFAKSMATENLLVALSKNPQVFQPDYEQTITHSKFWIRQRDPTSSDSELNPFNESFFDADNQLGVAS